jgi:hypothetical protein
MDDLQRSDVRHIGIFRSRTFNAAACVIVAGTFAASVGTRLVVGPRTDSMRLPDSNLQLLAVPHPDRASRDPEDCVVTASASSDSDSSGHGAVSLESDGPDLDPDERQRRVIVGKWHDEYRGKRHLTVRADGTGTMVVEPDGIGKKLFAARLTFDIEWSIADGRVMMKTLGGEPKSKVQLILKIYGQEADYTILELNDDRLLLLDADGKTRYDWRRPESASE